MLWLSFYCNVLALSFFNFANITPSQSGSYFVDDCTEFQTSTMGAMKTTVNGLPWEQITLCMFISMNNAILNIEVCSELYRTRWVTVVSTAFSFRNLTNASTWQPKSTSIKISDNGNYEDHY